MWTRTPCQEAACIGWTNWIKLQCSGEAGMLHVIPGSNCSLLEVILSLLNCLPCPNLCVQPNILLLARTDSLVRQKIKTFWSLLTSKNQNKQSKAKPPSSPPATLYMLSAGIQGPQRSLPSHSIARTDMAKGRANSWKFSSLSHVQSCHKSPTQSINKYFKS